MTENVNPADRSEAQTNAAQDNAAVEPTESASAESQTDATSEQTPVESSSTGSSAAAESGDAEERSPASTEASGTVPDTAAPTESLPEAAQASEAAPQPETTPADTSIGTTSGGEAASTETPATSGQTSASTDDAASTEVSAGEAGAASTEGAEGAPDAAEPTPEPGMSLEEMRRIWDELEAKKNSREPVEATITGSNRGGVVTEYKGLEIFVPLSHWSIDRGADTPDVTIGEPVTLYILEMTHFDTDARRVTGTRRSILRKELIDSLQVGQRMVGRVSSITDFGAFVDIGGVDGLLHVSEMSYARNKQPGAIVRKGDELEVVIKNIEKGGKRISLGHKELFNSPWVGAAEKYPPDSIQTGKVVSLTDLGAFVELEPGVDGLIRPRELSWTQRIGAASDVLKVGQDVSVMVLNVNEEQERMSLSLKRASDNPWPEIVERFGGDTQWEAEVIELSNKGAVVSVEGVEGFLPRGRMGRDARKLTELKAGDKLQVRVVEIDPKRPSVIFGIPMEGGGGGGGRQSGGEGGGRRGGGRDRDRDRDRMPAQPVTPENELKTAATVSSFSLGDMLGDALREKLGLEPEPQQATAPAAESQSTSTQESSATPSETIKTEKSDAEIGNANDPLATSAEERTVVPDEGANAGEAQAPSNALPESEAETGESEPALAGNEGTESGSDAEGQTGSSDQQTGAA